MTAYTALFLVSAVVVGTFVLAGTVAFMESLGRRLDPDHREPWEHVRREPS